MNFFGRTLRKELERLTLDRRTKFIFDIDDDVLYVAMEKPSR